LIFLKLNKEPEDDENDQEEEEEYHQHRISKNNYNNSYSNDESHGSLSPPPQPEPEPDFEHSFSDFDNNSFIINSNQRPKSGRIIQHNERHHNANRNQNSTRRNESNHKINFNNEIENNKHNKHQQIPIPVPRHNLNYKNTNDVVVKEPPIPKPRRNDITSNNKNLFSNYSTVDFANDNLTNDDDDSKYTFSSKSVMIPSPRHRSSRGDTDKRRDESRRERGYQS
jgi:hypothetical protein